MVDGVLASCYASFDHDVQHVVMKTVAMVSQHDGSIARRRDVYACIRNHPGRI